MKIDRNRLIEILMNECKELNNSLSKFMPDSVNMCKMEMSNSYKRIILELMKN